MEEIEASAVLPQSVVKVIGQISVRKSLLRPASSVPAKSSGRDDDDDDDDDTRIVSLYAILTDFSIILVDSNDESAGSANIVKTYSFPSRAATKAVDAVFMPSNSAFVLARADSKSIFVPLSCEDTSVCAETSFPSPIRKLFHLPDISNNLLVCCENGNSFVTSSPELPLGKDSQANNNTGIIYVDSCSDGALIFMLVSSAAARSLSSTSSSKLVAINVNAAISSSAGGNSSLASKWLLIRNPGWKDSHPLPLTSDERIVSLVSHDDSFSIILEQDSSIGNNYNDSSSNNNGSADSSKKKRKNSEGKIAASLDASSSSSTRSSRWIKFDSNGNVLFERSLGLNSIALVSFQPQSRCIWIASSSSNDSNGVMVTAWSLNYGTCSAKMNFLLKADTLVFGGARSHIGQLGGGASSSSTNSSNNSGPGIFIGGNRSGSSGPISLLQSRASGTGSSLYRIDLDVNNNQRLGSLLQAIGGNSKGRLGSVSDKAGSDSSMTAKRSKIDATIDLVEFECDKISSLREKISGGDMSKYFDSIGNKLNQVESREGSEYRQFFKGRDSKGTSAFYSYPGNLSADQRLYVDTDLVAIDTFLELVEQSSAASVSHANSKSASSGDAIAKVDQQLTSREWAILKVLIRAGLVHSGKCPSLFDMVCITKRVDMLVYMAQYAPDLSEKTALQMLLYAGALDDAALSQYAIVDGKVARYGSVEEPAANGSGKGNSKTLVAASAPKDAEKEKTKKVGKKGKKDSDEMVVENSGSTNDKISGSSNSDSSTSGLVVSTLTPLLLLRTVCEAFLHRRHSYSKILLSDMIRRCLSSKVAILLLRIFMEIVLGQSPPRSSDSTSALSFLSDLHMQNACSWIEAIIDAHFVSTSMQIRAHLATRQAFVSFFETVLSTAEASSAGVEELSGIWSHVLRLQKSPGGGNQGPPQGLYRKETLKFS